MHRRVRLQSVSGAALALALAFAGRANAVPALQLYAEGAVYDQDMESWVTSSSELKLWVIGATGHVGSILDVQLVAAVLTGETGSISITAATTTLLSDISMSSVPVLNSLVGADGTRPLMSNGHYLPPHETYGPGTSFKQWALGDFTLRDTPVGDFIETFPTSFPTMGQVNAYSISITGYSTVHFDTFNHVEGRNRALFAPFSHDANPAAIPEPSSVMLIGFGLLGAGGWAARRRRR